MILEFCGLPGAGKTTLEKALVAALIQHSHQIRERDQVTVDYIRATIWSGYSHGATIRRAVTALYKARLLVAAFGSEIRRHNPAGFTKAHLLRCSMRLAEDICLGEWFAATMQADVIANLSEGMTQHLAACTAWQQTLRRKSRADDATSPVPIRHAPHRRVIIHVDVPREVALERLRRRGVPAYWPRHVPAEEVVDAFARGLRHALQAQASCRSVAVLHVDGAIPEPGWSAVAVSLARQCLSAEPVL